MAEKRDQGKTAFVKAVLAKNNQANPKLVNEAWKGAGHDGSISGTLVQKMRSEMKLTRNIRPGRKPTENNGTDGKRLATSNAAASAVLKRPVGRPPAHLNGSLARTATIPHQTGLLTKLEAALDEMIFEIKTVGGLPDFEETLRKARRILARSHQD